MYHARGLSVVIARDEAHLIAARPSTAAASSADFHPMVRELLVNYVFSIPNLATIHPESNCYVVRGISRGLSRVQRISRSRVGGRFLSDVWGMRL